MIEWGVATKCRRGEATCGDLAVVATVAEGALVAAIDGLGHGRAAAHAARAAGEVVRARPSLDLVLLAQSCHRALRATRGAAISLAYLSAATGKLSWLGIGNVEGRVLSGDPSAPRPKGSLALRGGVAGHELPTVRAATIDVQPGDVLVLATDGIDSSFADALDVSGSAQAISERIIDAHWRPTDDALVVAVRYLGARR